ncbi:MAG: Uma2 family endonuclease [Blastocatellia bacterium]
MLVNVPPPSAKDEFHEYSRLNPELRIEQTKEGTMIIVLPTYSETGNRNFKLTGKLAAWAEQNGEGEGVDSSAGFILPNGAKRSPDASWIRRERWEALPKKARQKFAHVCPDFVAELRSRTDRLKTLQEKMEEYLENGAQLGWLIDPLERKVHIYRPQQPAEILHDPASVSGEPVLPGFTLLLRAIWD